VRTRSSAGVAALAAAVALVATACGGSSGSGASAALDALEEPMIERAAAPATSTCTDAEEGAFDAYVSVPPPDRMPVPGAMPEGSFMREIQNRKLVVGVDQTTARFGYRHPRTGRLEGFDIELLREVARAIYGDSGDIDDHIVFKTLTTAERVPAVREGEVDIVASLLTVTCGRAKDVSFTSVYHLAHQGVLVLRGSSIAKVADLDGRTVCATAGSTTADKVEELIPAAVLVEVPTRADCLVQLQQGGVDAVSADDTILVSFRSQDPKTTVLDASLTDEPYGMAISQDHQELVGFVNGVLAQMRADGDLHTLAQEWITVDGRIPEPPPAPRYR
jgi:polar amino acid transport system substrate-binding protein